MNIILLPFCLTFICTVWSLTSRSDYLYCHIVTPSHGTMVTLSHDIAVTNTWSITDYNVDVMHTRDLLLESRQKQRPSGDTRHGSQFVSIFGQIDKSETGVTEISNLHWNSPDLHKMKQISLFFYRSVFNKF